MRTTETAPDLFNGAFGAREDITCDDCGEIVTEATTTHDGQDICTDCIDAYSWCEACSEVFPDDDMGTVRTGWRRESAEQWCESCRDSEASKCDDCGEHFSHDSGMVTYLDGLDRDACDSCRESYYYCDLCDSYSVDGCDCSSVCECDPYGPCFHLFGESNDTLLTVTLADGVVSPDGVEAIRSYLHGVGESYAARAAYDLDPTWKTPDGRTYGKRLAARVWKDHGHKVPAEVVSAVGNIARENSTGDTFHVTYSRTFNDGPDAFGNSDSCWYNGAARENTSLCAFKDARGYGLRSWDEGDTRRAFPSGRAWVMPVDADLSPVDSDDDTAGYAVFNGYGELDIITAARIVAQHAGLTYGRASLHGSHWGDMYVNGGSVVIVGTPDMLRLASESGLPCGPYANC